MPANHTKNKNGSSEVDVDAEIHDIKTPLTALKLKVQLLQTLIQRLPQHSSFVTIKKLLTDLDIGFDDINKKLNDLRSKLMKRK